MMIKHKKVRTVKSILDFGKKGIIKQGGSYYVILPVDWIRTHKIDKTGSVHEIMDIEGRIIITPQ